MQPMETTLTAELRAALASLNTPFKIQGFLDTIPYNGEDRNRSPLGVLQEGQCHCYDGGLLGAALLRRLGHKPMILDLWPEPGADDDHVLALYRVDGYWGAVAKSNFANLRFREPIHRTIRELVLTYFENYYNVQGMKTLRTYTLPLDLTKYDAADWETHEATVDAIEKHLHRMRVRHIITPAMAARLSPMDERAYHAGMQGTNPEGLYRPTA